MGTTPGNRNGPSNLNPEHPHEHGDNLQCWQTSKKAKIRNTPTSMGTTTDSFWIDLDKARNTPTSMGTTPWWMTSDT